MNIIIFSLLLVPALFQPPPLPGVDYIMSGFDAAKMLSTEVGQSKFKIFDLAYDGGVVTLNNKQYTSSSTVQATVSSIKNENSCEAIFFSYEEFYRHYVESTTIGIGFEYMNAAVSLNYHQDLLQIYNSIKVNNQAVGTSQSWWSMYTISTPPPFLMPLHKFFSASLDALGKIKTPTTEAQQTMYNQVLNSYGTHYVSGLIMGAAVKSYTFVNDAFTKTVDYSKLTQDIKLDFSYNKAKFSGDHSSEEILNKTSVGYANNSNTKLFFTPVPIVQGGQPEWLAWEQQAPDNPQVLNTTVAPITDLMFNYPEVQAHAKKTIEYYLKHGEMPKLSDLTANSIMRLLMNSLKRLGDVPLITGLDVVGCGYDAMSFEAKMCVVDSTGPSDVWSNPNYPELQYSVPFGFIAVNKPESMELKGTVIFSSFKDFVIHTYWEHDESSGGFLGFGAKHKHTEVEHYYEKFYKQYYNLALSMTQITWYRLVMPTFPQPKMSSIFQLAYANLPLEYNSTTETIFSQFIDAFGTHVVTEADFGGLVWAEDWIETCLFKSHDETWVREEVSRRWDPFGFIQNHHSSSDYKVFH